MPSQSGSGALHGSAIHDRQARMMSDGAAAGGSGSQGLDDPDAADDSRPLWRALSTPFEHLVFLDVSHSWVHGEVLKSRMSDWGRTSLRHLCATGAFWEGDMIMSEVEEKAREFGITVDV